jgi:CelD/BcsL family acetyltransferase involved in cellulose biosynthesis
MGTDAQARRARPFPNAAAPFSLEKVGGHSAVDDTLDVCSPDDGGWLELVRRSPAATAFHHPAWSAVVGATYGYPAFVLVRRKGGGAVEAGLPVIEVTNPLGRRRLVSLPFTDHCPPVLEEDADEVAFAEALATWRQGRGEGSLDIRSDLQVQGAHRQPAGVRHLLTLEPDPAVLFRSLDRNQIRRRVRRSRELGVEAAISHSRDELGAFYRLHCETRRRQGVPVQPRRFIENLWRRVIEPRLGFVVTARLGGAPIATAVFLAWNRTLIYKYSASVPALWNLGANFLVQWTAIEWGCENGYTTYDLGRTDAGHASLRAFKSGWGAREIPLVYTQIGGRAPRVAQGRASAALAHVIRRSPTAVCRALGEVLYRYAA